MRSLVRLRALCLIICGVGLLAILFFGFVWFVAFSDSRHVCPDGNQCSDAIGTMIICAVGVAVGLLMLSLGLAGRARLNARVAHLNSAQPKPLG